MASQRTRIGTIQTGGKEITYYLDQRLFVAEVDGLEHYSETVDGLEKRIQQAVSRTKVRHAIGLIAEVEDSSVETKHRYTRVVLRGQNTRTRQNLITITDDSPMNGTKLTLDYLYPVAMSADVTDAELNKLNQLHLTASQATAALLAFKRKLAQGKELSTWKLIAAAEKAAGIGV